MYIYVGKYCKQFSSSYEQIASLMITDSNVAVGKYNCEVPSSNNELCVKLGVDRYYIIIITVILFILFTHSLIS